MYYLVRHQYFKLGEALKVERVLFGTLIHYIMQGKIIAIQFAAETARSQIQGNALASGAPPQTP